MIDTQLYEQLATAIIAKSFEDYICAHLVKRLVLDIQSIYTEEQDAIALDNAMKTADTVISDCVRFFDTKLYKMLILNRRIYNPITKLQKCIDTLDPNHYYIYNKGKHRICKRKQLILDFN